MGAFTIISSGEVGAGSAANVTISSIPASYDHLYMITSIREGGSGYKTNLEFRFNDDSSPYSNTHMVASSSTAFSHRTTGDGDVISICGKDGVLADTFSNTTLWVINYAGTDNFKQCIMQAVVPNNTTSSDAWTSEMSAGLYGETGAIHKIRMQGAGSPEFTQYTSWVLYGVTGV
jgi:hypothetical protein